MGLKLTKNDEERNQAIKDLEAAGEFGKSEKLRTERNRDQLHRLAKARAKRKK